MWAATAMNMKYGVTELKYEITLITLRLVQSSQIFDWKPYCSPNQFIHICVARRVESISETMLYYEVTLSTFSTIIMHQ